METHLLALQAKVLLWTGLGWFAIGIYLGHDPMTIAWRAALGAFAAMWLSGKLLRQVAVVIEDAAAAHAAELQLATEKAAEKAAVNSTGPSSAGARR